MMTWHRRRDHRDRRDHRVGRAWRARLLVAAVGAAVLAVSGGCASLPRASAPQPFDVTVPTTDPIGLAARGPTKGSTPQTLVYDFLLACAAGTTDDFTTARLFLTEKAATSWRPDTQVEVYSTDSAPGIAQSTTGGMVVTVTAPAVATVDGSGVLTRTADQSTLRRQFALVKSGGEWRIDGLDDGTVLSESSFAATYQEVSLYFPSTGGDVLVPDPRWYPGRRLATHLMTGLLGGPSEAVAPAVTTAVPEGASLPSQGIDISDRVAHVALTGTFPTDPEVQKLLAWQVVKTLTQAQAVVSVDLSVSGTTVDMADLPDGPAYRMDSPVAVTADGPVLLTGSATHPLATLEAWGEDASMPAIGPVSDPTTAWTTGDGLVVERAASGQHARVAIDSPTWPSVDGMGWVWSASSVPGGGLVVVDAAGTRAKVAAPFKDNSSIVSLRVSADGARAVLLRQVGGTRSVWVAPVIRDAAGTPRGLGDAVSVVGLSSGVADVSWAGTTTLVALRQARGAGGGEQEGAADEEMAVVPLGGFVTTLGVPTGSRRITAGTTPSSAFITTADGSVHARSGSVWQSVTEGLSDVNYPG